jgi:Ca-activated chloride channel family protein
VTPAAFPVSFLWPQVLWMLLCVQLLAVAYVLELRRRKKVALRYANLSLVREAMSAGGRLRRHVPPALFLVSFAVMVLAAARPAALVSLPTHHDKVILAMDVSGSMRAADVKPNRLVAAQEAARKFIEEQPRSTRIGVVSFAATASLVQPPTDNREDILQAIERFQLQRGTAIGSGIIVSLAALFPDAGLEVDAMMSRPYGGRDASSSSGSSGSPLAGGGDRTGGKDPKQGFTPVPPGSYKEAAIILLTDGQRTTGPDSIEAARMAAERGVRIFTVGIGTVDGETIGFGGWSMRVRLDEETLKTIADLTRGEYFYAADAASLKKVYQTLTSRFVMEKKETEITALFSMVAAFFALLSVLLSMFWFGRVL